MAPRYPDREAARSDLWLEERSLRFSIESHNIESQYIESQYIESHTIESHTIESHTIESQYIESHTIESQILDADGLADRAGRISRMRKAASLGCPRLPLLYVPRRNRDVCPDAVLAVSHNRALNCPDCVEY